MSGKSIISLFLLNIVWGSFYVANKFSLNELSPFFVGTTVRFLALIFLLLYIALRGNLKKLIVHRTAVPKLFIIGLLGFSLDITAFLGLQLSTASNGSILLKSDVLFTNFIALAVLKQRFTFKDWGLTGIILFGTFMVIDVDFANFQLQGFGDLLFLASAFCVALNGFVIKSVQNDERNNIEDSTVAFYNNLITFIIFSVLLAFTGQGIPGAVLSNNKILYFSLIYTGLMQTMLYILYYYNLRRLPVWIVRIMLLMMPIFASLISFFVLDEKLNGIQLAGMATVLLGTMGIILEHRKDGKKEE